MGTQQPATRRIRFTSWDDSAGLSGGTHEGTTVHDGTLVLTEPEGVRKYDDPHRDGPAREYEYAVWTSPDVSPGFGFTELVA